MVQDGIVRLSDLAISAMSFAPLGTVLERATRRIWFHGGDMARKQSAGTLLYRHGSAGLEVLIVHPSGPYNRHAPWSIPKGVPNEGETDLERTARRETWEETGVMADDLISLGFIEYKKSRKDVYCFAGPAPADADPRPTSWEVDQARFVSLDEARQLLHRDQAPFLDRLLEHLGE